MLNLTQPAIAALLILASGAAAQGLGQENIQTTDPLTASGTEEPSEMPGSVSGNSDETMGETSIDSPDGSVDVQNNQNILSQAASTQGVMLAEPSGSPDGSGMPESELTDPDR